MDGVTRRGHDRRAAVIKGEFRAMSLGSLAVILAAVVVGVVLWGPTNDEANVDGPLIHDTRPFSGDGEDALIAGTLVVRDDCLLLDDTTDASFGPFAVVWPAGTSWDADARAVVLPSGARIAEGDQVTGGGAYRHLDDLTDLDDDARTLARRCTAAEDGEVARFDNRPDAARPADD